MVTFSTKKSTINPRASKCIQNISSLSIQRGIWYISYYIFCFIYPLILSSLELTCSLLESDFCLSWWNGCCWFFLLGYVSPSLNNFLSNLFWANFTADEINTIACAEIRFHLYFVQLTIAFFLFVLHKGFTTFTIISSIADCTESSLAL